MAGWNLKNGNLISHNVSEEQLWALFNFVFSDSSIKRNTYKFGLIKSILDNLFNAEEQAGEFFLSYYNLFSRFAENYWNLVVKYHLKQMRKDGKSEYSKLEVIFRNAVNEDNIIEQLEFGTISEKTKTYIIERVLKECKKNVVGALYNDFEGLVYSFDLKGSGIYIGYKAYDFMLKHKYEIEKLNYYSWAKFLESINDDSVLPRVIDKLELSTPRRKDLSVYREILRKEFEEDTCFYCGKKLGKSVHVDHFIPWSFVKDDKLWNFVLACPRCNEQKNNKLPSKKYLEIIKKRNNQLLNLVKNDQITIDFSTYTYDMIERMWKYAHLSGLKEYKK